MTFSKLMQLAVMRGPPVALWCGVVLSCGIVRSHRVTLRNRRGYRAPWPADSDRRLDLSPQTRLFFPALDGEVRPMRSKASVSRTPPDCRPGASLAGEA